MISPLTLNPTPARIKATVRGIRLIKTTVVSELFQAAKSNQLIFLTPIVREAIISRRNINTNRTVRNLTLFRLVLISANILIRIVINKLSA